MSRQRRKDLECREKGKNVGRQLRKMLKTKRIKKQYHPFM
jgi:hypothetical protein